jgi:hypothetical protein
MVEEPEEDIFDKVNRKIADKRRIFDAQFKAIVVSLLVSTAFSFVVFLILSGSSETFVCTFTKNDTLLYLWPPNGSILPYLNASHYTQFDKCAFIAMRSIMSLSLLGFVIFTVIKQIAASDDYHIPGLVSIFVVLFLVSIAVGYAPPTDSYSRYRINFRLDVERNIVASGFAIYPVYMLLLMLCYRVPAYVRSLR